MRHLSAPPGAAPAAVARPGCAPPATGRSCRPRRRRTGAAGPLRAATHTGSDLQGVGNAPTERLWVLWAARAGWLACGAVLHRHILLLQFHANPQRAMPSRLPLPAAAACWPMVHWQMPPAHDTTCTCVCMEQLCSNKLPDVSTQQQQLRARRLQATIPPQPGTHTALSHPARNSCALPTTGWLCGASETNSDSRPQEICLSSAATQHLHPPSALPDPSGVAALGSLSPPPAGAKRAPPVRLGSCRRPVVPFWLLSTPGGSTIPSSLPPSCSNTLARR